MKDHKKGPEIVPFPTDNVKPWDQAREYFGALGRVPPSFTTPVRTLLIDQQKTGTLSPASQFLVTRLLRSPTIKAVFYYLTLTLHGERVSNSAYLSSADLMRLYSPSEIAALLCLIYVYRRTTKAANLTNDPDWQNMTKATIERIEVGGHFGYAVPEIGATKGLLTGGMREIVLGIFAMHDLTGFRRYRQHLTSRKIKFDLDFEMQHWGCTHLDLAGNILQIMGFGISTAHAFMIGLGEMPPQKFSSDVDAFEFYVAQHWINSLLATVAAPEGLHRGQYYPSEISMHKLLYEVSAIVEKGSKHNWLNKTKESINPHDTPQLYQEFLLELQNSQALEEFYQENIPEEVLETLSEEDLKELVGSGVEDTKG